MKVLLTSLFSFLTTISVLAINDLPEKIEAVAFETEQGSDEILINGNNKPMFSPLTLDQLRQIQVANGRGLIFAISGLEPENTVPWHNVNPRLFHYPDLENKEKIPVSSDEPARYFFADHEGITDLGEVDDENPGQLKKLQNIARACYGQGKPALQALFIMASHAYLQNNFSRAKWLYEGLTRNAKELDKSSWAAAHFALGKLHYNPPVDHPAIEKNIDMAEEHFLQAAMSQVEKTRDKARYYLGLIAYKKHKLPLHDFWMKLALTSGNLDLPTESIQNALKEIEERERRRSILRHSPEKENHSTDPVSREARRQAGMRLAEKSRMLREKFEKM